MIRGHPTTTTTTPTTTTTSTTTTLLLLLPYYYYKQLHNLGRSTSQHFQDPFQRNSSPQTLLERYGIQYHFANWVNRR